MRVAENARLRLSSVALFHTRGHNVIELSDQSRFLWTGYKSATAEISQMQSLSDVSKHWTS